MPCAVLLIIHTRSPSFVVAGFTHTPPCQRRVRGWGGRFWGWDRAIRSTQQHATYLYIHHFTPARRKRSRVGWVWACTAIRPYHGYECSERRTVKGASVLQGGRGEGGGERLGGCWLRGTADWGVIDRPTETTFRGRLLHGGPACAMTADVW